MNWKIQRLVSEIAVLFHVLYEQGVGVKVLLLLMRKRKILSTARNKERRKFFSGGFKNLNALAIIK